MLTRPLAAILLVLPATALAECTCPAVPEPIEALKRSTVAFIGSAERVVKSPVKEGYLEARFTVMKRLRGLDEISGDKVYIFTPDKTENCGYPFSAGQDYVVFAQGNPAGLRTTSCLGTVYLDNVTGEIDELLKAAESLNSRAAVSVGGGEPKPTVAPRAEVSVAPLPGAVASPKPTFGLPPRPRKPRATPDPFAAD